MVTVERIQKSCGLHHSSKSSRKLEQLLNWSYVLGLRTFLALSYCELHSLTFG